MSLFPSFCMPCFGATTPVPVNNLCPSGVDVVQIKPLEIIGVQPVVFSAFFPTDTVIIIEPITIMVTNAPTTVVVETTVTMTSNSTLTIDAYVHLFYFSESVY